MTPYKWQEAVMCFVRAVYFAIVADCGCGKTLAAIKIALMKMMPTIVIAPTHRLCGQWRDDLLENGIPQEDIWLYSKSDETGQKDYRERFERWLEA